MIMHTSNILSSGELDGTSVGFSDKSSGGRKPKIYNLDMILSVGYRVNSKRGIAFRRWANSVLKQYVIQGYAINEKRLQALERTVDIQTKMLACTLEVEESDILKAVTSYTDALMLLDQYDHQSLKKPTGNRPIYKITYEECKKMVSHIEDSFKSDVFGVEKEKGKGLSECVWWRCLSIFGRKSCKFIIFHDKRSSHPEGFVISVKISDHTEQHGSKQRLRGKTFQVGVGAPDNGTFGSEETGENIAL